MLLSSAFYLQTTVFSFEAQSNALISHGGGAVFTPASHLNALSPRLWAILGWSVLVSTVTVTPFCREKCGEREKIRKLLHPSS